MDADNKQASIAIELCHPDPGLQQQYFKKFQQLEKLFHQTTGEEWDWQLLTTDEDSRPASLIIKVLKGVNIFNMDDWPVIISFSKPRIITLDTFWIMVKEGF